MSDDPGLPDDYLRKGAAPSPWGAPDPAEQPTRLPPADAPPSATSPGPPTPNPYEQYPPTDYGQYPPAGYGQPYPGGYPPYPGGYAPVNHPAAGTAMALGLIGLVGSFICGVTIVLCPFAMVMGRRAVREIDESGGAYGGRDQANVGFITGIIGSVLLAVGVLGLLALVGLGLATTTW